MLGGWARNVDAGACLVEDLVQQILSIILATPAEKKQRCKNEQSLDETQMELHLTMALMITCAAYGAFVADCTTMSGVSWERCVVFAVQTCGAKRSFETQPIALAPSVLRVYLYFFGRATTAINLAGELCKLFDLVNTV